MSTFYAVMRAFTWDAVEIGNGIPLATPPDGPQRFIPLFKTQEQAAEWASDGDIIRPFETLEQNP